jgi:hypothetical protein
VTGHHKPEGPEDPRWRRGSVLAMTGNGWVEWCGPMRWRVRYDLTLPYSFALLRAATPRQRVGE